MAERAARTEPSSASTEAKPRLDVEVEREVKFDVPHRWTMPRLDGVAGVATVEGPRRMTQTATYLDTRSLTLLRARHTLRRRTGGTDAGWHLKTPGDESGRVEHRLPLGRSAAVLPPELADLVFPIVGTDALVPVATLRTRRTRRALLDEAGVTLVHVEDDVVEATTYLQGERITRWREVEVELVNGTADDLAAVTAALVARGLRPSDSPSKVSRALAEPLAAVTGKAAASRTSRRGDGSGTSQKSRTSQKSPKSQKTQKSGKSESTKASKASKASKALRAAEAGAGETVVDYLAAQVAVLQSSERALRADEPDAIHRARVATRRLRSTLRSYRALLDRERTDAVRREVRWLTGVLGEPRDAEVLAERLSAALDTLTPELVVDRADVRLREALTREHEEAHARMIRALESPRFERLMADLIDLIAHPPLIGEAERSASAVMPRLVAKASGRVVEQAERAEAMPEGPDRDEAIHEVRKLAKVARYAAEAAGESAGAQTAGVVNAWKGLQEALGDHQDSVVSRQALIRLAAAARSAGQDTFTYGVLAGREEATARRIEERYQPLLDDAIAAANRAAPATKRSR